MSQPGSSGRNGGVAETTMSSAAIVSAGYDAHPPLVSLSASLLLCCCFCCCCPRCLHYRLASSLPLAPADVALAAFVVTLAVVATTFLAIEVASVVDCCLPSPPEEDHLAMALVALALFVALVFVVVTALIVAIAFADCCEPFVVYLHPSPRHQRRMTPPSPAMA